MISDTMKIIQRCKPKGLGMSNKKMLSNRFWLWLSHFLKSAFNDYIHSSYHLLMC